MATAVLQTVVRHVRTLVATVHDAEATDRQLLDRFLSHRDEDAFAALVRRHAALVRGVCRRVLGDAADADDVFQAVFVVLARKAATLPRHSSVAPWLHAVAYRLACRARADAARRTVAERGAPHFSRSVGPEQEALWRELQVVLDAELQSLSERHRAPLVLCYLQGLTRDEAAERLGWSLGTLKRRLERGRELLRVRLTRRGLTVGAAALAAFLAQDAASSHAATLAATTVRIALGSTAPARVAQLAEGAVGISSVLGKSKVAAALLLTLGLVGGVSWAVGTQGEREAKPAAGPPQAEIEKPKTDLHGDPLPAGALARLGTLRLRHGQLVSYVGFLPGGQVLLTVAQDGTVRQWDVANGKELRRFSVSPQGAGVPPGGLGGVVMIGGGGMQLGYSGPPMVVVSGDGSRLVSQAQDGVIRVWDIAAGKELRRIDPPESGMTTMALSADGKQLAILAGDGTIRLRDTATGKEIRWFGKPPEQPAAAAPVPLVFVAGPSLTFSPDGKTLAVAGSVTDDPKSAATVKLWETATGKEVRRFADKNAQAIAPAFSPDGKFLAWAKTDGTIRVVDPATGKDLHQFKGPSDKAAGFGNVMNFTFTTDGKFLVACGPASRAIVAWNLATGKEQPLFAKPVLRNQVVVTPWGSGSLAFSPDGKQLALAGENHAVQLVDVATGKEVGIAGGHRSAVASVRYSADGKTVTTTSEDFSIRAWDAATGKELWQVKLSDGSSTHALSADGRMLAVVQIDGAIHLLDPRTNKELQKIEVRNGGVSSLAFAPDGKTLAVYGTSDKDIAIRLYDTATGKERLRVTVPAPTPEAGGAVLFSWSAVTGIVFTPDGKTLAGPISPQTLGLWDVASGRELHQIEAPDNRSIQGAVFTPDGRSVALDLGEDVLSLFEVATGKERRHYGKKPPKLDSNSGDAVGVVARAFAVGGGIAGGPVALWTRPAPSIGFSPNGKLLAHGRSSGGVHFFDTATGKEVGHLAGHQGSIDALAFGPEGKTLATGSRDTTGLVWDVADLIKHAKPSAAPVDAVSRWKDLASDDASRAYDAVGALTADQVRVVAFLKDNLPPATAADADKIAKLVAELDSEQFAVRKKAGDELERIGESAAPALRKALEADPSAEVRKRLGNLLAKATAKTPSGESLRSIRAVEVLEMIATPEARRLLHDLSTGAADARLTREAQSALERLQAKP